MKLNFKPVFIFLFFIIKSKAYALDGIDELKKRVNSPEVVVVGPTALNLKSSFTIIAEKIILDGPIVTNGYALTLICRYLEQTNNGSISGFSKEERPFDLQPSQIGAPQTAPKLKPGVNGVNGFSGIKGIQGNKQPGSIQIFAGVIVGNLTIDGEGQVGTRGGQGQPGQDAGPGGEGQEARRHFLNLARKPSYSGAPGGEGGVGGDGGRGGEGGNPIPIEVHYGKSFVRNDGVLVEKELERNPNSSIISKKGPPGQGGVPGENGKSGHGGVGGPGARTMFSLPKDGGVGQSGPEQQKTGSLGPIGNNMEFVEGSVVINPTYKDLMSNYFVAQSLVDVSNDARVIDTTIRDLILNLDKGLATDLNARIKILKNGILKIIQNKKIFQKMSDQKLNVSEDTLKIQINNEKTLTSLLKILEAHDGEYSESQFKQILKESELNLQKALVETVESMKQVALRIMEIKDRSDYMEPQIKSINGYKIFGPKALEEWVFRQDEVGARDKIALLPKIRTELLGRISSYPLRVLKETDFDSSIKNTEIEAIPNDLK